MFWLLLFMALPFVSLLGVVFLIVVRTSILKIGVAIAALIAVLIMGVFNGTPLFTTALAYGGGLLLVCYLITTTFCKW